MALRTVGIGHTTALEHWHGYTCPAHSDFRERPTLENAVDCAKAIWELRDWLWRETYPGLTMQDDQAKATAFDQQLFASCPEMPTLRDIAESGKHGGQLSRGSVIVHEIRGVGFPSGTLIRSGPLGDLMSGSGGPFGNRQESWPPLSECTLTVVFKDGRPEQSLPDVTS